MSRSSRFAALLAGTLAASLMFSAEASIVASSTRVVYNEKSREATLRLRNDGTQPALVKVWIDAGDPNAPPENVHTPFVIAPVLFRVDPSRGQQLRFIYAPTDAEKSALPNDRETVFWINILDIPPVAPTDAESGPGAASNRLQIAIRTRLKLFLRPDGLKGDPRETPAKVTWRWASAADGTGKPVLRAHNGTPFVANFSRLTITGPGGTSVAVKDVALVRPGETVDFQIADTAARPQAPARVQFQALDDYGAPFEGTSVINELAPAAAPVPVAAPAAGPGELSRPN